MHFRLCFQSEFLSQETKELLSQAKAGTYARKMASFITARWESKERTDSLPLHISRVALHTAEAKAAHMLRWHGKVLGSFEWHRRLRERGFGRDGPEGTPEIGKRVSGFDGSLTEA